MGRSFERVSMGVRGCRSKVTGGERVLKKRARYKRFNPSFSLKYMPGADMHQAIEKVLCMYALEMSRLLLHRCCVGWFAVIGLSS